MGARPKPPRLALVLTAAALLAPAAALGAAALARPGTFDGATAQDKAVSFRVADNSKWIRTGNVRWVADCLQSGAYGYRSGTTFAVRVRRTGRFAGTARYAETIERGYTARVAVTLRGRFRSPRLATGLFRARPVVYDASGEVADRCDTGRIAWRARHR
jgi:hypothetical protein